MQDLTRWKIINFPASKFPGFEIKLLGKCNNAGSRNMAQNCAGKSIILSAKMLRQYRIVK